MEMGLGDLWHFQRESLDECGLEQQCMWEFRPSVFLSYGGVTASDVSSDHDGRVHS